MTRGLPRGPKRLDRRVEVAAGRLSLKGSSGLCGRVDQDPSANVVSVRLTTVEVCADCRVHWTVGERPKCVDPDHSRRQVQVHQHQDLVVFPDGTPITAVSFAAVEPYERDRKPDFGLYLDPKWNPPWPHAHLEWPDFGVPTQIDQVLVALDATLERARAGQLVEVGCIGAHGRTGTALACLAILSGVAPVDAVGWVRTSYCTQAIETPEQAAFVTQFKP